MPCGCTVGKSDVPKKIIIKNPKTGKKITEIEVKRRPRSITHMMLPGTKRVVKEETIGNIYRRKFI